MKHSGRFEEQGLEPSYIADRVVEAIRSQQLYVLTHPAFSAALEWRFENIVKQRNPTLGGMKNDMKVK